MSNVVELRPGQASTRVLSAAAAWFAPVAPDSSCEVCERPTDAPSANVCGACYEHAGRMAALIFVQSATTRAEMVLAASLMALAAVVEPQDSRSFEGLSPDGWTRVWFGQCENYAGIKAQFSVLPNTRSDFAVRVAPGLPWGRGLLVEVDDPSHWRSEEKSVADKVRDRAAALLGWATMRFSNQEVLSDPTGAAGAIRDWCAFANRELTRVFLAHRRAQ